MIIYYPQIHVSRVLLGTWAASEFFISQNISIDIFKYMTFSIFYTVFLGEIPKSNISG